MILLNIPPTPTQPLSPSPEGVRPIVDSTTISNLFYNLQPNLQSTDRVDPTNTQLDFWFPILIGLLRNCGLPYQIVCWSNLP